MMGDPDRETPPAATPLIAAFLAAPLMKSEQHALDPGEQNRGIPLPGRVGLHISVSLILVYGLFELISRNEFQKLREYDINLAHGLFLLVIIGLGRILLSSKRGFQAMPF